ncbi:scopoletin glucosyltransferase-like [Phalaenopsis equestris]|uniref:scopoletin glucosyltransferase-like n=1 Tax=Phalaenopsis equestris TaxID=78828 RepID=UPI0009E571B2|nr:scopoletin glucosyltransferase-like [Phalaenopsis equestris]
MGSTTAANGNLHMLFFPYMAQGHMLPMVDIAKLFAARGVYVSIVTTPANATLIRPTIHRSNFPITLHLLTFPSAAVGLPEGCENRSSLPSDSHRSSFYRGIAMLRQPFDDLLKQIRPDCVVTDMFMPWTYHVATDRGIPRLVFDGTGFLPRCADDALQRHRTLDNLPPDASSFTHPGLPHRIDMLLSQTHEHSKRPPGLAASFDAINSQRKEVDPKSYGVLVNSFYELEPKYVEYYRKVVGRKAWHIGPVSLCNQDVADKSLRGGDHESLDGDRCLKWLDEQKPGSVVYVCFGSATVFAGEQIREIAMGLEAAGHSFILVAGRSAKEEWFPEGFEERINGEGKGMLIRGWAQQLMILNHAAVGGFVTHCGWNSLLEGISAGLPMVTWPLFADQFYNEKLLVQVLEVGVAVGEKGDGEWGGGGWEEAEGEVMGSGEEADGRRRRARDLGEKARRAVEMDGSSYDNIGNLIRELLERKAKLNAA